MSGRVERSAPSAGYSGTPLAGKLGITSGCSVLCIGAPAEYQALLEPVPVFVTKREELSKHLSSLRKKLKPETPVWVSWPKKASKVPTTVTEDVIREIGLPIGYVDVKVCAVSEVWSGLKLVVRKELR